ncbi:hypothetical protein C8Q77DRAFT_1198982 [Trametes polyzona]|nr:hypothetical protein C8Q77DRAFT_1198982 [Trametes polyzona]
MTPSSFASAPQKTTTNGRSAPESCKSLVRGSCESICGFAERSSKFPRTLNLLYRPDDVDVITTYYLVQHELSELVLRVVGAHQQTPFPSPLMFEGQRYTLTATHAPWPFGKRVSFMWGDDRLQTCEDKWTFVFKVRGAGPS